MRYRLDELSALASELGLETRRVDSTRLDVLIDGASLSFCNSPDDAEGLVGFDDVPWHSHGIVQFLTGESTYIDCDELDILMGLGSGDLLVVTQFVDGVLRDRWIVHRKEPFELRHVEAGEELRIFDSEIECAPSFGTC
jgi:hypothetical protein